MVVPRWFLGSTNHLGTTTVGNIINDSLPMTSSFAALRHCIVMLEFPL